MLRSHRGPKGEHSLLPIVLNVTTQVPCWTLSPLFLHRHCSKNAACSLYDKCRSLSFCFPHGLLVWPGADTAPGFWSRARSSFWNQRLDSWIRSQKIPNIYTLWPKRAFCRNLPNPNMDNLNSQRNQVLQMEVTLLYISHVLICLLNSKFYLVLLFEWSGRYLRGSNRHFRFENYCCSTMQLAFDHHSNRIFRWRPVLIQFSQHPWNCRTLDFDFALASFFGGISKWLTKLAPVTNALFLFWCSVFILWSAFPFTAFLNYGCCDKSLIGKK